MAPRRDNEKILGHGVSLAILNPWFPGESLKKVEPQRKAQEK